MSDKVKMTNELLDAVFRDSNTKFGLKFFEKGERTNLLLEEIDDKIQIFCAKRNKWLRAKPEEVIRQLFIVWIQKTLKYSLNRIEVEWSIQMGEDSEKERADIVVFSDEARTDPYIIFELKRPQVNDGLEQLRSYLRWTGCFFGCWSNGNDYSFQLKEEDSTTKKGPYKFRDIPRLPKFGYTLDDILKPLTYQELIPINDMRVLIEQLEHDALANAGVNAFDELFKLFFAKLHDELRPRRKPNTSVEFRVPPGSPEDIYQRFNTLFQTAKSRPNWDNIFDEGEKLKLTGEALRLCAAKLEPYSLMHTDLEVIDAAFEYLINPEQKGQKGQYFTPRPVVKMAVKMMNPKDGEKVIDPACGSCGFLIHTLRHTQKKYNWTQDRLYRYASEYLYAIDFDERLKKVAKTMMIIAGDGKANVFCVNALDVREWQNSEVAKHIGPFSKLVENGDFDLVLTNPPFAGKVTGKPKLTAFNLYDLALSGQLDENDDEIETDKKKSKRKIAGMKRDILFLERCLDILKPGGRLAIVLPQGNFNNLGTMGLRQWIASKARILAVVGLHVNAFKKFTNTKTSVLFLQKWGPEPFEKIENYPIFMATSNRSGKDNGGKYIFKKDGLGNLIDEEGIPITESNKPPAIDHDLDEIADSFVSWGKTQGFQFLQEI